MKWLFLILCGPLSLMAGDTVKVFVLCGQSNMEGKAKVSLLQHQITQDATRERFAHLHKGGVFHKRDDVFIKFLGRKGKLSVGFGSPGRIGPELEFGRALGDHFKEPVYLIKCAWGGKSLYRDFRPPSAGLPPDDVLEALHAKTVASAKKKNRPVPEMRTTKEKFGTFYRATITDVKSGMKDMAKHFPELAGKKPELAGFVWFQGWNDLVNPTAAAGYTQNMAHFIRDVRKDLNAPKLPFVIGQLGVGGDPETAKAKGKKVEPKKEAFKAAQIAPAALPEFKGTVGVVKTDQFWDWTAQAVFDKGWRDHFEEWERVGSDYPYHYLGSTITMSEIGKAFGQRVISLQP